MLFYLHGVFKHRLISGFKFKDNNLKRFTIKIKIAGREFSIVKEFSIVVSIAKNETMMGKIKSFYSKIELILRFYEF